MILISGGALVSLFTILSHTDIIKVHWPLLAGAFVCFALCLIASIVSLLSSYSSQMKYLTYEWKKLDHIIECSSKRIIAQYDEFDDKDNNLSLMITNFMVFSSIILFIVGSGLALSAVQISIGANSVHGGARPLAVTPI